MVRFLLFSQNIFLVHVNKYYLIIVLWKQKKTYHTIPYQLKLSRSEYSAYKGRLPTFICYQLSLCLARVRIRIRNIAMMMVSDPLQPLHYRSVRNVLYLNYWFSNTEDKPTTELRTISGVSEEKKKAKVLPWSCQMSRKVFKIQTRLTVSLSVWQSLA